LNFFFNYDDISKVNIVLYLVGCGGRDVYGKKGGARKRKQRERRREKKVADSKERSVTVVMQRSNQQSEVDHAWVPVVLISDVCVDSINTNSCLLLPRNLLLDFVCRRISAASGC
jgi:hypothetical protein